jgi:hypothetical protein
MFLSTFAMLAFATANPVIITPAAQAIGCHPQPGKVMGCVTNSHVVAQQRAMGTHQPVVALADNETAPRTIACHPDPSRNRGCFRPAPGALSNSKVKTAAATAAKAETARNETPAAPSETERKAS